MPFDLFPGVSARQAPVGARAAKTSLHDAPMGEEDARTPGQWTDEVPAGTDLTDECRFRVHPSSEWTP
jgi:hypothetical protein